jgi:hypothetical protein
MNRLTFFKLLPLIFVLSFGLNNPGAASAERSLCGDPEKKLFGKSLFQKRKAKIKEPRKVVASKKAQEKKEKKLKKDYNDSLKQSRKRTFKIQTPEVQGRMKQDQKDIKKREKEKKRSSSASTRKAGKKYK